MPESATELLEPQTADSTDELASGQVDEVVAADLLVEEVSIDGMCGVY
jgi:mycofactocin precursor